MADVKMVKIEDIAPYSGPKTIPGIRMRPAARALGITAWGMSVFEIDPGTTGYPETVLLRLITSKGGPNVKLSATEDGSGMVLGGEPGYVQILSRSKTPFIKLVNKNGREQEIKP